MNNLTINEYLGVVKYFYRNIYKKNKGFVIIYREEQYNHFRSLENALMERDLLEAYDWDYESLIMNETSNNNPYMDISLPPFPDVKVPGNLSGESHTANKNYVYYVPTKNKYQVRKLIDGEIKVFGYYNTHSLADKVSDKLQDYDWPDDWKCVVDDVVNLYNNNNCTLDSFVEDKKEIGGII
jgi:hypothetical protein